MERGELGEGVAAWATRGDAAAPQFGRSGCAVMGTPPCRSPARRPWGAGARLSRAVHLQGGHSVGGKEGLLFRRSFQHINHLGVGEAVRRAWVSSRLRSEQPVKFPTLRSRTMSPFFFPPPPSPPRRPRLLSISGEWSSENPVSCRASWALGQELGHRGWPRAAPCPLPQLGDLGTPWHGTAPNLGSNGLPKFKKPTSAGVSEWRSPTPASLRREEQGRRFGVPLHHARLPHGFPETLRVPPVPTTVSLSCWPPSTCRRDRGVVFQSCS